MEEANNVNSEQIVSELAVQAAELERSGAYPEEWLGGRAQEPMSGSDRELHDNLIIANQNADVVGAAAQVSRGKSPKAWLKRFMFRLLLFHLDQLNHYSTAVARVLNRMNAELAEARLRDSGLREEMERLFSVFGHRLADLEEAKLAERIAALEDAHREKRE